MPPSLHFYCYYLSLYYLKPLAKQAQRKEDRKQGGGEGALFLTSETTLSPLFLPNHFLIARGKHLSKIKSDDHVSSQMKFPQWLSITFIVASDLL